MRSFDIALIVSCVNLVVSYEDESDRKREGCQAYMERCHPKIHRCCAGLHCVYQRCYWSGYRDDLREYTLQYLAAQKRKLQEELERTVNFNITLPGSTIRPPYVPDKFFETYLNNNKPGIYRQDTTQPPRDTFFPPRDYYDRNSDFQRGNQPKSEPDRLPWYYYQNRITTSKPLQSTIRPIPPQDTPSIPLSAW